MSASLRNGVSAHFTCDPHHCCTHASVAHADPHHMLTIHPLHMRQCPVHMLYHGLRYPEEVVSDIRLDDKTFADYLNSLNLFKNLFSVASLRQTNLKLADEVPDALLDLPGASQQAAGPQVGQQSFSLF